MLKRLFLVFIMSFMLPIFADTMPYYMNSIPKDAIGFYQAGNELTLYQKPDSNSGIIKKINFSYDQETMPDGVFGILINDKKLGLIYVTDIDEDGWIEVIYDKHTGAKGWVLTEDKFQFMPWLNFYNMYGRKYGLRVLKDAPDEANVLHAKSEDLSQSLNKLNHVKQIKLTAIRGNWALVSVFDLDKIPKTGYMKWRSNDGIIYAFPNIK